MKFKLGDPVRVIASPSEYFDQVGTITGIHEDASFPLDVAGIDGKALLLFGADELILAENGVVTARDLLGIAPDFTGGKTTDEYMNEQRGRA